MSRLVIILGFSWALLSAPMTPAQPASPPAQKDHPLPMGALARLDKSRSKLHGTIWRFAFSPDGKTLAMGAQSDHFCLWAFDGDDSVRQFGGHQGTVCATWFSGDGQRLASVGGEGTLRWWDLATGKELKRFGTPSKQLWDAHSVYTAAFTTDGKKVVLGGWNGDIRIWETDTGKQLQLWKGMERLAVVAVSLDGTKVATPFDVWDMQGNPIAKLTRHGAYKEGLAFSPDGTLLAGMNWGPDVFLWKPTTGKVLAQLKLKGELGSAVAFSPHGQTLATAEAGAAIRLWEVRTRRQRLLLQGHVDPVVTALAFSPNGQRLVSSDRDAATIVWDATGLADKKVPVPPLQQCWTDLGSADAAQGYRALWGLVKHADKGVALLSEHLRPVPVVADEKIQQLITDLDSKQFIVRDKAAASLRQLHNLAEPALRKAHATAPTLEAALRIEALLRAIDDLSLASDQLRAERVVEVLEHIGSPAARKVLQSLAQGASPARLTQQAAAALKRLGD